MKMICGVRQCTLGAPVQSTNDTNRGNESSKERSAQYHIQEAKPEQTKDRGDDTTRECGDDGNGNTFGGRIFGNTVWVSIDEVIDHLAQHEG